MGLNRLRLDSVKEKRKEKTRKQLQEENEALAAQVTDLQMALCDVYELAAAAATMGGKDNG